MLPAEDGDCLLLEYGEGAWKRRILIDGGRSGTYPRVKPMLGQVGVIDLLVVTHVDQDHILGVLAMLEDAERTAEIGEVWFNGYDELLDVGFEKFGAQDGERLTTALVRQKIPWNAAFGGRSVEVGRPMRWFEDGSSLTLLSPDRTQLERLAPAWKRECEKHGLIPGREPEPVIPGFEAFGPVDVDELAARPFQPDTSLTNATSVAFLFEFDSKRIVLTGDGVDRRLVDSIRALAKAEGGRLRIDALKVPHHGSEHNVSVELLSQLDCPCYLISTSGARHNHPHDVAMARIIKHGAAQQIIFNYRSRASRWSSKALTTQFGYRVVTPPDASTDGAITVSF